MKNITKSKLRNNDKAISPVLAVLLMIAIAVAAALISYSWVATYLSKTTTRMGHAIQIQSIFWKKKQEVFLYVQNVGDGTVTLMEAYVDGVQIETGINQIIAEGQTYRLKVKDKHISFFNLDKVHMKLTCKEGTIAEGKYIHIIGIMASSTTL